MNLCDRKKSSLVIRKIVRGYGSIAILSKIINKDYKEVWKWAKGVVDIPVKYAYILSELTDYSISDMRGDLKKKVKEAKKMLDA